MDICFQYGGKTISKNKVIKQVGFFKVTIFRSVLTSNLYIQVTLIHPNLHIPVTSSQGKG